MEESSQCLHILSSICVTGFLITAILVGWGDTLLWFAWHFPGSYWYWAAFMCFLAISRSLEQFLLTQVITFHIWCLVKESHSDYFLKEAETPFVSPRSRIGSDRHRLHKAQNSKGRKGCPVWPLTCHPASPVSLPVFIPYAGCQVGSLLLVSLSLKLLKSPKHETHRLEPNCTAWETIFVSEVSLPQKHGGSVLKMAYEHGGIRAWWDLCLWRLSDLLLCKLLGVRVD